MRDKIIQLFFLRFYLSRILFCFYMQTLTELDLSENQIGESGADSLAEVLQNNKVVFILVQNKLFILLCFVQTLTKIDLTKNGNGRAAVVGIPHILKNNKVTECSASFAM